MENIMIIGKSNLKVRKGTIEMIAVGGDKKVYWSA
jgi:hypothetical protein